MCVRIACDNIYTDRSQILLNINFTSVTDSQKLNTDTVRKLNVVSNI